LQLSRSHTINRLLIHEVHLSRVQVRLTRYVLIILRGRLLGGRPSRGLAPILVWLLLGYSLLPRTHRLLLLLDGPLRDLERWLHRAPIWRLLLARPTPALGSRYSWRQLGRHLGARLQEQAFLNLELVDFVLHALEFLSHLVALLHACLQLLANMHYHLARALQLLRSVVSRTRCGRGALGESVLFEMRRQLVVRAHELAHTWELQEALS